MEQAVVKHEGQKEGVALVAASNNPFLPAMTMEVALQKRDLMIEFTKRIMLPGQDFGEIPGTDKPTLLKPGAEKLASFFGLEPEFIAVEKDLDWMGVEHGNEPFFYYHYRCRLMKDGRCLGAGEGSCNSWESKYRYRWVSEDRVPGGLDVSKLVKRGGTITEPAFAIEKSETGGKYGRPIEHWQRFRDAIERGTARKVERKTRAGKPMEAWEIEGSEYRINNPDISDLVNTVMKMAQKRALVAAVLIATNASELYTQDVEDLSGHSDSPYSSGETRDQIVDRRKSEITTTTSSSDRPPATTTGSGAPTHSSDRGTPAAPGPSNGGPKEEVPAEVQQMWGLMRDFQSCVDAFAGLKAGIEAAQGSDLDYYRILGEYGMRHGNDLKGKKRSEIRLVAFALWKHWQKCKEALQEPEPEAEDNAGLTAEQSDKEAERQEGEQLPFEASDDDLPENLGGTWKGDGSDPAAEKVTAAKERLAQEVKS